MKLRDYAQITALACLCLAICLGIVELAIYINRPFAYLLAASFSAMLVWGAVEIYERAK